MWLTLVQRRQNVPLLRARGTLLAGASSYAGLCPYSWNASRCWRPQVPHTSSLCHRLIHTVRTVAGELQPAKNSSGSETSWCHSLREELAEEELTRISARKQQTKSHSGYCLEQVLRNQLPFLKCSESEPRAVCRSGGRPAKQQRGLFSSRADGRAACTVISLIGISFAFI